MLLTFFVVPSSCCWTVKTGNVACLLAFHWVPSNCPWYNNGNEDGKRAAQYLVPAWSSGKTGSANLGTIQCQYLVTTWLPVVKTGKHLPHSSCHKNRKMSGTFWSSHLERVLLSSSLDDLLKDLLCCDHYHLYGLGVSIEATDTSYTTFFWKLHCCSCIAWQTFAFVITKGHLCPSSHWCELKLWISSYSYIPVYMYILIYILYVFIVFSADCLAYPFLNFLWGPSVFSLSWVIECACFWKTAYYYYMIIYGLWICLDLPLGLMPLKIIPLWPLQVISALWPFCALIHTLRLDPLQGEVCSGQDHGSFQPCHSDYSTCWYRECEYTLLSTYLNPPGMLSEYISEYCNSSEHSGPSYGLPGYIRLPASASKISSSKLWAIAPCFLHWFEAFKFLRASLLASARDFSALSARTAFTHFACAYLSHIAFTHFCSVREPSGNLSWSFRIQSSFIACLVSRISTCTVSYVRNFLEHCPGDQPDLIKVACPYLILCLHCCGPVWHYVSHV